LHKYSKIAHKDQNSKKNVEFASKQCKTIQKYFVDARDISKMCMNSVLLIGSAKQHSLHSSNLHTLHANYASRAYR